MRRVLPALLLVILTGASRAQPATQASATTSPPDLTDQWRHEDVVVDVAQDGTKLTGTFRYVPPNGYGLAAGTTTFRATLAGDRVTGTVTSVGLRGQCPDLRKEGSLKLRLAADRETLEGTAEVHAYEVEGCRLEGASRVLKLRLKRRGCRRERAAHEAAAAALEAATEARVAQERTIRRLEQKVEWTLEPAAKKKAEAEELDAIGALAPLETAEAAAEDAAAKARAVFLDCVGKGGFCQDWRKRYEEVRDEWFDRHTKYNGASRELDLAYAAWLEKSTDAARKTHAHAHAFAYEFTSLLELDRFRDPKWIKDLVKTAQNLELAAGIFLIGKAAAGALRRKSAKAGKEADEAVEAAAKEAETKWPRLKAVLALVRKPIDHITDVSKAKWDGLQTWIRNPAYHKFNKEYAHARKKLLAGSAAEKREALRTIHELDVRRWEALREAYSDLQFYHKRLYGKPVEVAFTGSTSKVAEEFMRTGVLPSSAKLAEMKDYARLGSDIDFQFLMRNPRNMDELAGFYERQAEMVKRFNDTFSRKMGFHPDLVDVKLFPSTPWWNRARAKNPAQALEDLKQDLAYLKRNSPDGEFYLTPGSRKMKELMDEGGDSVWRINKGGKGTKVSGGRMEELYGDVKFHAGDAFSVVEEQLLFAQNYLKKMRSGALDPADAARKYSKYYLRGVFGRLVAEPGGIGHIRAFMKKGFDLQTATYKAMLHHYPKKFTGREQRTIWLALQLKGSKTPGKLLNEIGGDAGKLAEEFVGDASRQFQKWHAHTRDASEAFWKDRLAGATDATRAGLEGEKKAYDAARTYALTRGVKDPELLKRLGVTAEHLAEVRKIDGEIAAEIAKRAAKAEKKAAAGDSFVRPALGMTPGPSTRAEDVDDSTGAILKWSAWKTAEVFLSPMETFAKAIGHFERWRREGWTDADRKKLVARLAAALKKARENLVRLWKVNDHEVDWNLLPDPGPTAKAYRALFEGEASGRAAYGTRTWKAFLSALRSAQTPEERECMLRLLEEWRLLRVLQQELTTRIDKTHLRGITRAHHAVDLGGDLATAGQALYSKNLSKLSEHDLHHPMAVTLVQPTVAFGAQAITKLKDIQTRY